MATSRAGYKTRGAGYKTRGAGYKTSRAGYKTRGAGYKTRGAGYKTRGLLLLRFSGSAARESPGKHSFIRREARDSCVRATGGEGWASRPAGVCRKRG
jgi:hypothetical protein